MKLTAGVKSKESAAAKAKAAAKGAAGKVKSKGWASLRQRRFGGMQARSPCMQPHPSPALPPLALPAMQSRARAHGELTKCGVASLPFTGGNLPGGSEGCGAEAAPAA